MDAEQRRRLLEKASDESFFDEYQPQKPKHHGVSMRLAALLVLVGIVIGSCAGSVAGTLVFNSLLRHDVDKKRCDLPTDDYLGDIPFVAKTLEADQAFVDADPCIMDSNFTGPWKDVNPSGSIALDAPSLAQHGIDLMRYGRKSLDWSATPVAFGISVMRQMHCVIEMKRALISWDKGEGTESGRLGHLNHCVEILRQTVMCGGDT